MTTDQGAVVACQATLDRLREGEMKMTALLGARNNATGKLGEESAQCENGAPGECRKGSRWRWRWRCCEYRVELESAVSRADRRLLQTARLRYATVTVGCQM